MILDKFTIDEIKEESGLLLEQVKDFSLLASKILDKTGRGIGITTLKRLLGYINDDRQPNEYTLNTLAMFLGFSSWDEYSQIRNIHSEWGFEDKTIYINQLDVGRHVRIKYFDRVVLFLVVVSDAEKVLKVLSAENSSLLTNDILYVDRITIGENLCAEKVIRGSSIGNYRTHSEITSIEVI